MLVGNKLTKSAVNMTQYGIQTVVLTEHKNLDEAVTMYLETKDEFWMDGKGKQYLYDWLKAHLLKEDEYFNNHRDEADINNPRWRYFCDDCVSFAALSFVLFQTTIQLVHPKQYGTVIKNSTPKGTSGEKPSLIKSIAKAVLH